MDGVPLIREDREIWRMQLCVHFDIGQWMAPFNVLTQLVNLGHLSGPFQGENQYDNIKSGYTINPRIGPSLHKQILR